MSSGEKSLIYSDAGQNGMEKREEFQACDAEFRIASKPGQHRVLPDIAEGRLLDLVETAKTYFRARVEHPFHSQAGLGTRGGGELPWTHLPEVATRWRTQCPGHPAGDGGRRARRRDGGGDPGPSCGLPAGLKVRSGSRLAVFLASLSQPRRSAVARLFPRDRPGGTAGQCDTGIGATLDAVAKAR